VGGPLPGQMVKDDAASGGFRSPDRVAADLTRFGGQSGADERPRERTSTRPRIRCPDRLEGTRGLHRRPRCSRAPAAMSSRRGSGDDSVDRRSMPPRAMSSALNPCGAGCSCSCAGRDRLGVPGAFAWPLGSRSTTHASSGAAARPGQACRAGPPGIAQPGRSKVWAPRERVLQSSSIFGPSAADTSAVARRACRSSRPSRRV